MIVLRLNAKYYGEHFQFTYFKLENGEVSFRLYNDNSDSSFIMENKLKEATRQQMGSQEITVMIQM